MRRGVVLERVLVLVLVLPAVDGRRQRAVLNLAPCAGLTFLRWSEPVSEVDVTAKQVGD